MKNSLIKTWLAGFILATSVTGMTSSINFVNAQDILSFKDVNTQHQNYEALEYLKVKGIIKGYDDGTFKPEQTINRAEALKILFLTRDFLNKIDQNINTAKMSFPDVKPSDWFYEYVEKAFKTGIVEGYEDGTYKPANQINRAESMKVLVIALHDEIGPSNAEKLVFNDLGASDWYFKYVDFLLKNQFIEPNDQLMLKAGENISRGDFAEIAYRMLITLENDLEKYPLNQNWPVCNNFTAGYRVKHPYGWQKVTLGNQFLLWKQDLANGQVSFARTYPNSVSMIFAIDENPAKLTLNQYLDGIEYDRNSKKQVLTLNGLPYGVVDVEESGLKDSYFELPDRKILIVYAQTGTGELAEYMNEQVRYVLGSVRASSSAQDSVENCLGQTTNSNNSGSSGTTNTITEAEKLISEANKLLLKKGEGEKIIDSLSGNEGNLVIETDTIGVGTGAIDYYYFLGIDMTLKYERETKTGLALKNGKTSSF